VTRSHPTREIAVETPLTTAQGRTIAGQEIAVVPILRAGLAMEAGITRLIPTARVGHIGIYRDPESLEPVPYYSKLPEDIAEREVLILDPMLATGGSAAATARILKDWGATRIKYVGLIAAPEGIKTLRAEHPDIPIHVAAVDDHLNEVGFIVPGLGDAGDRQFGTG
jgi:uracil phosphoribosyltransferase